MNKTKIKQEIEQSEIIRNFLMAEKNLLLNKIKNYNKALKGVDANTCNVNSLIMNKKISNLNQNTIVYVFLGLKNNSFFLSEKTIQKLKEIKPLKIFFIVPSNDNAYFQIFKNKLISTFPDCIFWYDWQEKNYNKNKGAQLSITPIFEKFIIFFSEYISRQWFNLSLKYNFVTINFVNANWGEDIVKVFPLDDTVCKKSDIKNDEENLKINLTKKNDLTLNIESKLTILLFNWLIQKYFITGQIKSLNQQIIEKEISIDKEKEKEKKLKRALTSYIINEDLEESNIISINKKKGDI